MPFMVNRLPLTTVSVIGLPIACVDYAAAIDWVFDHARRGDTAYAVEAANTHVASLARSDRRFGAAMAKFDLICPDGMPLVWSVNRKLKKEAGQKNTDSNHEEHEGHEELEVRAPLTLDHCPMTNVLTDRVYGPTLMLKTIKASAGQADLKHFLLGGAQSTLDKLTKRFADEHPSTQIVGTYSPPYGDWPDDEFDRIADNIRASGANLVWVGLGCPKQETWIADNKQKLPSGVYFGIGAAFAFHAGEVKQAPLWIQKRGLEWAYRMATEPRRLFKRYLVNNSRFLWYSLIGGY